MRTIDRYIYGCADEAKIWIHKDCFSVLQDILVPPEYHMAEPKEGYFWGENSHDSWYYHLEIHEKSSIIEIDGLYADKIYSRFSEYSCIEFPVYLAIALLGKQQKYYFKITSYSFDGHCGTKNYYGVIFDGQKLIYRESWDFDFANLCFTCECGEEVEVFNDCDLFHLPVGKWTEKFECLYCGKKTPFDLRYTSEVVFVFKTADGKLSVEREADQVVDVFIEDVDGMIKEASDIANKEGISSYEAEEPEVAVDAAPKEVWEYNELSDGTIEISKYNGNDADVRIPAKIDKKRVTRIGYEAFDGRSDIASVVIPEGVRSIGDHSFRKCSGLISVSLPKSLRNIYGDYEGGAFSFCTGLASIDLPEKLERIDYYAFFGCTGLRSVRIPDSVKKLKNVAFGNCTGLESVVLPNNAKLDMRIGIFAGCEKLTTIDIPDKWGYIVNGVFTGMTGLKTLKIPDNIRYIDECSFSWCSSLEKVEIPDSVTELGSSAFANCPSLTSVNISKNVKCIPISCFENCVGLTSIVIPDNVKVICAFAFRGCTELTSVNIPKKCKKIWKFAFSGCDKLKEIVLPKGVEVHPKAFYKCGRIKKIEDNN